MKKETALLLILSTLFSPLIAITAERQMLRAKTFGEAGNYKAAYRDYNHLLIHHKEPWEQAIIKYNIANLLLKEGRINEAIETYEEISEIASTNLLFFERVKNNLSIARWKLVSYMVEKQKSLSFVEIEKALLILNTLLDDLNKLEKRSCKEAHCPFPKDKRALQTAAEQMQNRLLEEKKAQLLDYLAVEEELLLLQASLKATLNDYTLFSKSKESASQMERTLLEAKSFLPLWEELKKTFQNSPVYSHFERSYSHYLSALQLLEKKRYDESFEAFHQSSQELKKVSFTFFGSNIVEKGLSTLSLEYKRIIGEAILSKEELVTLQELQLQLTEKEAKLKPANKWLKQSIDEVERNDLIAGNLFLVRAFQSVRRLLWEREKVEKQEAEVVLIRAISEESAALLLNQIAQQGKENQLAKPIEEAQQEALSSAHPFREKILAQQQALFLKNICLCKLLTRLMPLFTKGEELAKEALANLNRGLFKAAAKQQEAAIKNWQEALNLLEQEQESSSDKEEESQEQKTDELLRLLQQMEQDDRAPKRETQPVKRGIKPW